jgi:hypothetical protein
MDSKYSLFENLFDPCLATDSSGIILFVNSIAQETFGKEVRQSIGKSLSSVITFKAEPIEQKIVETKINIGREDFGVFQVMQITQDTLTLFIMRDTSYEIKIHDKYKEKTKALIQLNQDQEKIIEQRTQHLSFANKLLENVVSIADQVVLYFNQEGALIDFFPQKSQLKEVFQNTSIQDIFLPEFNETQTNDWLRHLKNKNIPVNDLLDLTPTKANIAGANYSISFHYSEIINLPPVIVVILKDLTKEEKLIELAASKNHLIVSIYKASIHHAIYGNVVQEALRIFDALETVSLLSEAKKSLHALRGSLSCFGPDGFEETVKRIENLEDILQINKESQELKANYIKYIDVLYNHLPYLKDEFSIVPKQLLKQVANGQTRASILRQFELLDLGKALSSFEKYVFELSHSTGISVHCSLKLLDKSQYLDNKFQSCITQFLIHGIRNSFAHVLRKDLYSSIELREELGEELKIIIETTGLIRDPNSELDLSGKGQGIKLVDDLAKLRMCKTSLSISLNKRQSVYVLSIPSYFIQTF